VTDDHEKRLKQIEKDQRATAADTQFLISSVHHLNNHSRINNIEINCLEEVQGEDLTNMLISFAGKVEVQLGVSEIDKIHRINSHNKTQARPIVARFVSNIKKTQFMEAIRNKIKKGDKITADLFGSSKKNLVFINHHQSPQMKYIYKEVRQLRPGTVAKTGYYEDGTIWATLNRPGNPSIRIRTMEGLERLKGKARMKDKPEDSAGTEEP